MSLREHTSAEVADGVKGGPIEMLLAVQKESYALIQVRLKAF